MPVEKNKIAAFEQTFLPHLDAAYNLARWIVTNDQDAEDMVQEAFLRAFKYFDGFHGDNARAWLLAIVRNVCYTWLRENRSELFNTSIQDDLFESDSEANNPETLLQHYLNQNLVQRVLKDLPLEFREIIILRELEDLSYKEIAQVAGIPIGTVMSRLARAHQRLKESLIKLGDKEGLNES